jgi:hypothetical protein
MLGTQAFNAKGHLSICTGVTIEARRASDVDDDQVRRDVLRLLLHLCYYNSRMSARILISGLLAVLAGTAATVCTAGEPCAVCESCKRLVCNDLL